jgi:hypothetical protein
MESVYGKTFMRPGVVGIIDKSGINRKIYLNMLQTYRKDYEMKGRFELADLYICKINDICKEKGVSFHLLPCPVSEDFKSYVEEMRGEYMSSGVYKISPAFMDDIFYYPGEQAEDGRHFSNEYASRENLNLMIRQIYGNTGLTDMLTLE